MLKLPQWIVTDLDETLLHRDRSISVRSLKAIGKIRQKGSRFAIATTRNQAMAQRYIDELAPDAMVISGGALAKIGDEIVYRMPIDAGDVDSLIPYFQSSPYVADLVLDSPDGRFGREQTIELPFRHDVLSMFVWIDTEHAESIVSVLRDRVTVTHLWEPGMYRISHVRATKHDALKVLLQDIPSDEVVCFGDDLMDVGMLGHFHGIAVNNALQEAKLVAKQITDSHEKDGVAKYLEAMLANVTA